MTEPEGNRMRVLLVGAGGFIGRRIAQELGDAGHRVVCCGRDLVRLRHSFPANEIAACDFARDRAEDWAARLAGIDAVVNAAGIFREPSGGRFDAVHSEGPRALFDACAAAGVRRLVQMSALGADEAAQSRFHRSKRGADDYLCALAERRGETGWTVFRPSLVIGRGGQSTALFSALAALPWPVRLCSGKWAVQPIHVSDLAKAVRLALESEAALPSRLDLPGAAPMTTDELTLCLRDWLGLPRASFARMPWSLLRLAARMGDNVPMGALSSESLAMLERGNVADTAPLRRALGWEPRPLTQALAAEPASEADLWHARLFFLKPSLRIGLALIWIFTAIVSAFLYPLEKSVHMVEGLGLNGAAAEAAVYAGAAVDAVLGFALLFTIRPALIGALQIAVMLLFTLLATIATPGAWLEPFGPLTKNLAVLLATLVMIALEAKP